MKKLCVGIAFVVMAVLCFTPRVLATDDTKLTDEQKGAISQNCSSIKQGLKNLQKVDSRTRVFLGSTYRNVLSNFVTPLNLRLVKDNKAVSELAAVQTDFAEGKDEFSDKFIKYSQSLEELINMDCVAKPEQFYEKLVEVRKKRGDVRKIVSEMNDTLTEHRRIVKKTMEEME